MKRLFLLFLSMFALLALQAQTQTLIISEVADPGDNYKARFVELYNATNSTIDLSTDQYYLVKEVNGGTSYYDVALTGTVAPGHTYVVAASQTDFESAYGISADQYNGNINGNGDDTYFLYKGGDHTTGTLVDIYGVDGQDGTGQPWEYTDSHAVRNSNIGAGNTSWTASEWTITSANVADMTPGQHTCDYPVVTPTKLVITQVNPNPTYQNWEFKVTVQAQDNNGTPGNVSSDVTVVLNTDGSGSFTGGTGTITSGSNSVTLTVTYDKAETFNLTASDQAGNLATSGAVSVTINQLPTSPINTTPDTLIFDGSSTLHDLGIYTYTVTGPNKWFVASSGSDYFMKVSNYPGNDATEAWAILPKFTGANNPIGNFVSASYVAPAAGEFTVKVSTDYPGYGDPSNSNWTDLTFNPPTGKNGSSWVWVKSGDIDLSSYGTDFYLAFVFNHPGGSSNNTIEVDTLVIYNQGTTTGINDLNQPDLRIYPNPATDVIFLNVTAGNVEIIDNLGRVVRRQQLKGSNTVNVSDLRPGVYLLRVNDRVQRFIKR